MIMTTTYQIEGVQISAYLGIVVGETVMGINVFRDFFASIRNIVGGRAASYEKALIQGRDEAFVDLERRAVALGADAVVGIDIDYQVIRDGMLVVSVNGTAVKLA